MYKSRRLIAVFAKGLAGKPQGFQSSAFALETGTPDIGSTGALFVLSLPWAVLCGFWF